MKILITQICYYQFKLPTQIMDIAQNIFLTLQNKKVQIYQNFSSLSSKLMISSNRTKYFMIPLFQVVKQKSNQFSLMEVNIEMYTRINFKKCKERTPWKSREKL